MSTTKEGDNEEKEKYVSKIVPEKKDETYNLFQMFVDFIFEETYILIN